ncbi:uncharacterized protein LOC135164722 isoform X1 [Diachasmimorpha longicaudata]|uniref:uncharacterized protein LOC135164722 isoform X1 n=1 Tax=Diachasmimorpha longicaudata TaxID=58733 RepID=UPI0030B87F2D
MPNNILNITANGKMILYTTLAVFAILCINHSEAMLDPDVVKWLENSIGETRKSLEEYKRQLIDNQTSLIQAFHQAKQEAKDLTDAEVRKHIGSLTKARVEGKDVGECTRLLQATRLNGYLKHFGNIDKCYNNQFMNSENVGLRIDILMSEGQLLQRDLTGIDEACKGEMFEWICARLRLSTLKYSKLIWQTKTMSKVKQPESSFTTEKFGECVDSAVSEFKKILNSLDAMIDMCLAGISTAPRLPMLPPLDDLSNYPFTPNSGDTFYINKVTTANKVTTIYH